jgi:phosphatidylinositol-4,5-bisphosphate 3-kinase
MQNGLNLEMNAYNVIETGNKIGFIEFVDNAEEISSIHKKYGNFQGPFLETSILQYVEGLWANEEDRKKMTVSRREYHTNFIKSTAGQCAATYVLGIGDRHTGNYMLQKYTGRFFHIDFGHFLGHFKKKFGIRRDVEPFIFSREMCHFIVHFNPDV